MTNTMQKPIEAVLFDLDGTLLDTAQDLAGALNRLLLQEGKSALPFELIRKVVSNGGNAMVSLGFGTQMGDPLHDRLYQDLLNLYGQHLAEHTRPFPGINAFLEHLNDQALPWGVVTNKPRAYSAPLMEQMQFNPQCATLVCPDDVRNKKPHPEAMLLACKEIGCTPEHTIYVGDHRRDIEAGQNAGMPTIAALYGYIEDDDNPGDWQADHYIQHAEELISVLNQIKLAS